MQLLYDDSVVRLAHDIRHTVRTNPSHPYIVMSRERDNQKQETFSRDLEADFEIED